MQPKMPNIEIGVIEGKAPKESNMKQRSNGEAAGDSYIETVKDAVEWLFLAYSLGHPDQCQCENCIMAHELAFEADRSEAA